MRWARHVARVREKDEYRVLVGKHEGQKELEDAGSNGKMILKLILQK
jgi:hypothetical protein